MAISIFSHLTAIIDPLQATSSSIQPCHCASLAILNAPVIELAAPLFSFFPSCWACWSALVLLFLWRHATKSFLHLSGTHTRLPCISVGVAFVVTPLDELPFCIFFDAHSTALFIGVGAALLATPGNERLFASFLMLLRGFCSSVMVSLLLWPLGRMASCVLSDAHSPGWRATLWPWTIHSSNDYKFRSYLNLGRMPLELVYYGYLQSTY